MAAWEVTAADGSATYYSGRSERRARAVFNERKAEERVMLRHNGMMWLVAQDPPKVQTPEQRRAKGMYS